MSREFTMNRRKFLGAAAGAAGAAAFGTWAPGALGGNGAGERLVPPGKLSVQQFSIRDAIARRGIANSRANGLTPTMGFLGGPDFPADPTDLGPLVELPGGFAEVFEYLASVGYRGIEFFQFSQGVNGPITTAEIRAALDAAGLASTGTHTGGLAAMVNPTTRQAQIDLAHTLGHTMIGTAGDPVGGAAANLLANWQTAASNYNLVGAALAAEGLRYYLHPEQNNYNFFNDPAHPELSHTHRLDWFTENTDPSVVFFEPDILHALAGRARFPDPSDGSLWGPPLDYWVRNSHRLLAWHIKDGSRLVPQPAPPANPFTQTVQRTPTFVDVIYAGEGSIGQGYPVDPDPAVPGFKKIFQDVGEKGSRYYIVESDSGPGPASDPGRSLRHAKISLQNMLGLRGGVKPQKQSSVSEDAPFESEAAAAG
jgi:sugar phosphate isomerase/epimerase